MHLAGGDLAEVAEHLLGGGLAEQPEDRDQHQHGREQGEHAVIGQRGGAVGNVVVLELADRPFQDGEPSCLRCISERPWHVLDHVNVSRSITGSRTSTLIGGFCVHDHWSGGREEFHLPAIRPLHRP